MIRLAAVVAAALLAACAGHRFEDEPDLGRARLAFRLPGSGWTEEVEVRRGEVAVVEVPGGEAVGGLALEMEVSVEAISSGSIHLLFRRADALSWPDRAEAVRYALGGEWAAAPWENADGEQVEVMLLEVGP